MPQNLSTISRCTHQSSIYAKFHKALHTWQWNIRPVHWASWNPKCSTTHVLQPQNSMCLHVLFACFSYHFWTYSINLWVKYCTKRQFEPHFLEQMFLKACPKLDVFSLIMNWGILWCLTHISKNNFSNWKLLRSFLLEPFLSI